MRVPLKNDIMPAVMAALGQKGIVEGFDYRGIPVIAAVRTVPNSPWFMVARMDIAEAYAPIRERLWLMIAVVCALLAAAGLGVGLLWRRQSHRFYREQYKSAEALRASETFLDSIIEHSPHAMWISNERGTLLRLNQACRDLLNITDDEVVGKYNVLEDSIVEKQGFLPLIRRVFEKGETARFTLHYDSADLKSLKLENTVSLILEVTISPVLEGKRVTNAIIQHVDVTERKKAEENIKMLVSLQQAFIAAIPDIIMEVDTNKIYTWANEPGIGFFGEDVIGKPADFYFVREQETYDTVQPIFNGDEDVIYVESWQRRKDGQERLLAWWCRVLKDQQGNVTGALSSARDITDNKLAEEEIKRLNEELEQRVIERTNQLEAVNKELESFAYSVSHDLRAPLRSVDGFSHALLEDYQGKLDATGKSYLERIRKATQHMGNLIDDILKLSRVVQAEFHREHIDLTNMIDKIFSVYKKNNPDRKVKMAIQKEIIIQGDPNLMQIALANLMDNAWKFTGKQKDPSIEFGAIPKEGENAFFLRDNGVGFDMSYVDKLFGAFQRLHTMDEFPGTGIGLATVQRIIHRHGGKIWAEGEVGKGATFFFTIPEG